MPLKPLIDADVLRYEVGFGSEWVDEQDNHVINNFDQVAELFDRKIAEICEEVWGDVPPCLYLTGDKKTVDKATKKGVVPITPYGKYVPNFREAAAITKGYKANRKGNKPFHFNNLTCYILNHYDCKVACGIEADDLLSIDHTLDKEGTIICSRDKDLRITPGKHFGWACGKQEGFGPMDITEVGFLDEPKNGKFFGGGLKFFYSQLITGDSVDNIPGIPRKGPAFAYKLLSECETEQEMFRAVEGAYRDYCGDETWRDYFKEQASLLWMIRELDSKGEPVHHVMFDEREETSG